MRAAPALAVVATLAALCGCGGASSPPPAASEASPAGGGGFVGTIDRARLLSACENARQADPLLATGVDTAQADAMLRAAADLLVRPPVDPEAAGVGRRVRADVAAHREAAALAVVQQFCRARGG